MRIFKTVVLSSLLSFALAGFAFPQAIDVSLPIDATGDPGTSVTIPITVGDLTGRNVIAYQTVIIFDETVLNATGANSSGTISEPFGPATVDTSVAGQISLGGFGTAPLSGSGILVNLLFDVVGQPGDTTDLSFDSFIFNAGTPAANTSDGKFRVGGIPDIAVNPTSHDYGDVDVGSSASQTFVVSNEATADLVVSATTLVGPHADLFNIDSGGAPFTLTSGATRDVVVSFNPTSTGPKIDTLRINSNDPDEEPFDVPLVGNGVLPLGTVVSLPTTTAPAGSSICVPMTVDPADGILSADVEVRFDPLVLMATDVITNTGFSLVPNLDNTLGVVIFAMAGATPLSGRVELVQICFNVIGNPGDCAPLDIVSASFNEGAIPATLVDGEFCVENVFDISGFGTYYKTNAAVKPVPNTTITLSGGFSATTVTDNTGFYEFLDVPAGNVTVTSSKSNDVSGITSFDASFVLQHAAGIIVLDSLEQIAGDVTNNGSVSSFDASFILRFSAGLIVLPFPVGKIWHFVPESRSYTPLNGNKLNQDYRAILIGDVTGNWQPPTTGLAKKSRANGSTTDFVSHENPAMKVKVLEIEGDDVKVLIELDPGNIYVRALDFALRYDAPLLSYKSSKLSDLTVHYQMAEKNDEGLLRIAMAGVEKIAEAAPVLELGFSVKNSTGLSEVVKLSLEDVMVNEETDVKLIDDEVELSSLTEGIPTDFELSQNYPNPFNPSTQIKYQLPQAGHVRLILYNLLGQMIRTLVDEHQEAGHYVAYWDGKNEAGKSLPSGVYVYRLEAEGFVATKKMLFVK